jgi:hypothetical protein
VFCFGFQCGDIWSNNVEYNLADEVEACFVYGTAPANPWASAIHGLDSSDRVVEVRGEETNFYRVSKHNRCRKSLCIDVYLSISLFGLIQIYLCKGSCWHE